MELPALESTEADSASDLTAAGNSNNISLALKKVQTTSRPNENLTKTVDLHFDEKSDNASFLSCKDPATVNLRRGFEKAFSVCGTPQYMSPEVLGE